MPMPTFGIAAVMVHHKQQLLAKLMQEPYHDSCRVSAPISRMTQYGFHNKLGYVNCKGVLEYFDRFVRNWVIETITPCRWLATRGCMFCVLSDE